MDKKDEKSDENFGWHSDWLMFAESVIENLRFYCPGTIAICAAADGLSNEFNECARRFFICEFDSMRNSVMKNVWGNAICQFIN